MSPICEETRETAIRCPTNLRNSLSRPFNGAISIRQHPFRVSLSVHSRYGLHTRAATNSRHASPEASTTSLPPKLLRLLSAGAVAGWVFHPLGKRRLVTAHATSGHSATNNSCRFFWFYRRSLAEIMIDDINRNAAVHASVASSEKSSPKTSRMVSTSTVPITL